jgi:ParB family chromosome partitioning protein
MAGLETIPALVKRASDEEVLGLALLENLQREDLNPMEEAQAYRRLADEFHLTQEQIADAVGKDRSSVANFVRLLRLPHEVRENVAAGTIAMGHARAILSLPDETVQLRIGREVVAKQLSVRETEVLVKKTLEPTVEREEPQKDVHTRAAEERLRFALGTPVRIVRKRSGGRIEVDFKSEDELQRIFEHLTDSRQ